MNGGQARAARKSRIADGCHAGGNLNACQARAARERIIADGCHAVGNLNACQARAAKVFVSCYVSVTYALNGRKVMT